MKDRINLNLPENLKIPPTKNLPEEPSSRSRCDSLQTTIPDSDLSSDDDLEPTPKSNDLVVSTFGNISIENSKDVHFGNKTIYQGPITVKQFVCSKHEILNDSGNGEFLQKQNHQNCDRKGVENEAFEAESGSTKTNNKLPDCEQITTKAFLAAKFFQHPKQKLVIILSIGFLLAITISILFVIILLKKTVPIESPSTKIPQDSKERDYFGPLEYPPDNITLADKLRTVFRLEWVAQPPSDSITPLKTPVELVIIMHTATENCSSQSQCILHVRYIQNFHMESKSWSDIGYNFLVGGDGSAYEGRGWKNEGAHNYGYNNRSIGIAFIGTFMKIMPPERQIIACKKLIQQGVDLKFIKEDYKLVGARQLSTTESPGKVLYEDIKTWPHWSTTP